MALLNVLITVPQPLRDTILTNEAYDRLCSFAQVAMNEDGRNWTGPEIAARLPGVDAMITGWGIVPLTEEVLAGADRLRLIAHAAGSVKGFATAAVFDPEPLPADHPLRAMPNVLLTPHVAGRTVDSHQGLMAAMIDEVERLAKGQPLRNPITRDMLATMA